MKKIPHLIQRRQAYYARVRIPADVLEFYAPQKEIVRSLKTKDPKQAKQTLHSVIAEIQAEFETRRCLNGPLTPISNLGDTDLKRMAFEWVTNQQTNDEGQRKKSSGNWSEARLQDFIKELEQEEYEARMEMLGASANDKDEGMTLAAKLLNSGGYSFKRTDKQFYDLGAILRKAIHFEAKRVLADWKGKERPANPFAMPVAAVSSDYPQISIGDLFDRYLNNAGSNVGEATSKNYTIIRRVFDELYGLDRPAIAFTRHDFREVRDFLVTLPSNPIKKTKQATLKGAVEVGKAKGLPLISAGTVNMHLQKLNAVLNYGVLEEYIPKNNARELSVPQPIKAKNRRLPFDEEQLLAIFNAPLYTGCKDGEHGYAKPGDCHPRNGRFWLPVISLYSGMRLGEIAQMDVADVERIDGVDVMLIRFSDDEDDDGPEKRIKTENGVRYVPVHPILKRIGFFEFVEGQRAKGEKRLFPEITPNSVGAWSHAYSKWFARFLKSSGAKKARTAFHSFRHSYRDALREAGISQDAVRQLGGWSSGTTDENYGSGLKASSLYAAISKLGYPSLDLSHLYAIKKGS